MSEIRHQKSRRDFLKKVGYTAPVILTLTAMPAFAGHGSNMVKDKTFHKVGNFNRDFHSKAKFHKKSGRGNNWSR
jgi:hypothetical protein